MTFQNRKKTYLTKLDKSKKGKTDEKIIPLIKLINSKDDYFTTSSCSGRIVLWKGSGKKDETEWLKVSHNLIDDNFFKDIKETGLTWLRLEPFILHVCCKDLDSANNLLNQSQQFFKKSSILSISNKIIVEIKGSEFLEIPLMKDNKLLIRQETLLTELLNQKLKQNHEKIGLFYKAFN